MRTSPPMQTREQLRAHYRSARRAFTGQPRVAAETFIHQHLTTFLEQHQPRLIGAYIANDGEVDLHPWLKHLTSAIALPRVVKHEMAFQRWQSGDPLVDNKWGIPEPASTAPAVAGSDIDLLLMPLVAYDGDGHRLGMGGGFYDRYLGGLKDQPYRMGVAFNLQHCSQLTAASWDIPMDAVVSEQGVIEFPRWQSEK